MIHIRPWKFFTLLPGHNPFGRMITIPLPFREGKYIQTILSLDTMLLITAARIIDARTIVEFGTCAGATALNLAINIKQANIHCVDIERRPRDYDNTQFEERIFDHTVPIAQFTPILADMVFQDINYTSDTVETGTRKAFECSPKCVAWHDYGHPNHPHVKTYLDSLAKPLIHVEDSWMVFWFADEAIKVTA